MQTHCVEQYRPDSFGFGGMLNRDVNLPTFAVNALAVFRRRQNGHVISARMQTLMGDMREVQKDNPFAKFVVFSQYKESVGAAEAVLTREGFVCKSIVSRTAGPGTQTALQEFHENPACNVLLLTMSSSSNGLTLTVAQTVYLLEPSADAAAEAQALSRVHRIGQNHNVRCVILYAENTCEERLLALRKEKKALTEMLAADTVMVEAEAESLHNDISSKEGPLTKQSKPKKNSNAPKESAPNAIHADSYFVGGNLCTLFGLTEWRKKERFEEQLRADARRYHG